MRSRLRAAVLLAVAAGVSVALVTPAHAATAPATWSSDLSAGESAGVTTGPDGVELAASSRPSTRTGGTEGVADQAPTGYLTLPPHTLARPTTQVESTLSGALPDGSTATVDVRGRSRNGGWTEWIPSTPTGAEGGRSSARLPGPTSQVQSRLVLTGTPGAGPVVDGLRQTAVPAAVAEAGPDVATESAPLRYSVFATREGLVGGTTANGHVITERDHFVALPSRRALSPRDTNDYSVKVCAGNGRCAFAPVWDVGPWNTRDDYWNPGSARQEWRDLPQGTPQAQAAFRTGYNGGNDQFGRKVANPAGIDLADGVFWDDLGLKDNATVTVEYLWTGSVRLSKVSSEAPTVAVRSTPAADGEVVGSAADGAAVPVMCTVGSGDGAWVQVGTGQFVAAAAVPGAGATEACAAAG